MLALDDKGRFNEKKPFCFDTICNITQEPQEQQDSIVPSGFTNKSAVIKCHQLLSKVIIKY